MASRTQFGALPNEIILCIIQDIEALDENYFDWAPLARVDRRCHVLVNPLLYTRGAHGAMRWAVETNNLLTLQAVLRYNPGAMAALVNATVPGTVLLTPGVVGTGALLKDWRRKKDWRDWRIDEGQFIISCDASLLHISCAHGHMDSTQFLLENGADMHRGVTRFCNCLHLESQVKLNSDGFGELFDGEPPAWMPLHHALCGQAPEIALLLLEKGAPTRVTPPDGPLVTALQSSAAHGAVDIVKYLLQRHRQHPTDDTNPATFDGNGYTAMHYLALCYDRDAVLSIAKQFINVGLSVDIESAPSQGDHVPDWTGGRPPFDPATAFGLACFLGNFSAAEALSELGAWKRCTVSGEDSLEVALSAQWTTWTRSRQEEAEWKASRLRFVRQLILAGAPTDSWLSSPLIKAARLGLHAEMELLLNFCAVSVEQPDEDGRTALFHAVAYSWPRAVHMLLDAGADVNAIDSSGSTPIRGLELRLNGLDYGQEIGKRRLEVLRLLLRYGANCGLMGQNDGSRTKKGLWHYQDTEDLDVSDEYPSFHESLLAVEMHAFLQGRLGIFSDDDDGFVLDQIFEHAAPVNINLESWQSAVHHVLTSLDDASEFNFKRRKHLCDRLCKFARRHGYHLDDTISNKLARVIIQKVEKEDDVQFIDLFFAMGDQVGVRTNTGVFTREAMLVLGILYRSRAVVRKLLESGECSVKGRIPSLSYSTPLHLAAITQEPRDIVRLLKLHGSDLDVNAVTRTGETALSIMIGRNDRSDAMLEAVSVLLTLGADPYLRCQDPTELMTSPDECTLNLLNPKTGDCLSRCAATLIGRDHAFRNHVERSGRSLTFPSLSCFDLAVKKDRLDIVSLINNKAKGKAADS